jgi:hypothetical protein
MFSSHNVAKIKLLITLAARIAAEESLPLNRTKTRVLRAGRLQTVTSVIVNKTLGFARQERRRLRAALHQKLDVKNPNPLTDRQQQRRLAYLRVLKAAQDVALLTRAVAVER